jgi:hypothetical protein
MISNEYKWKTERSANERDYNANQEKATQSWRRVGKRQEIEKAG